MEDGRLDWNLRWEKKNEQDLEKKTDSYEPYIYSINDES